MLDKIKHFFTGSKPETPVDEPASMPPMTRDDRWQMLNGQIVEAYRTSDWHSARMAHHEQAYLLFNEGKDHRRSVQQSKEAELRGYQALNLVYSGTVIVRTNLCCENCAPYEGLAISIAEAIERAPIPRHDCQIWRDRNDFGGWCRCYYEPVIGTD